MAEINNNINNFGYKPERIELKKENLTKPQENIEKHVEEHQYVPDTGILGRSQLFIHKGGNIDKSVNETVKLAQERPDILEAGEIMFDALFDKFCKEGLSDADAYSKAAFCMQEFQEISEAI